ncbi:hypothetical protein BS50DRAFT_620490 [Corynespora cassiicola Philippines]|uniref:Uncharacterized protein n=1 Tax=Corynespora cassiicola Philippines TaxID=1448308 RepID=A0A2T2NRU1_CORCC|nr:hypothetical protein BS50DRAFT_620490 [Corynespora cassiicola Philippines]
MALNATFNNATLPSWVPSGFQVASGRTTCPRASQVLVRFAIYNAISIAIYLLLGSYHVKRWIKFWLKPGLRYWKFWSGFSSVTLQILGIIVISLLIQRSGFRVDLWQLVQIWAVRPRASWFIGNMIHLRRDLGYMNGALDNIFVEIIVCGLGTVFVGRLAAQALSHPPNLPPFGWYRVACGASLAMLLSTGFEVIFALWIVGRFIETKGKAEARDMDSLRWIARFMIPVTCACSYLIWAAFLYSAEGAYCPGNVKYIDLTWGLVPIFSNLLRIIAEEL